MNFWQGAMSELMFIRFGRVQWSCTSNRRLFISSSHAQVTRKIRAVEQHVGQPPVRYFVDACSGVGTLGLAAACLGVPHVVINDAWYASAFWSAFNLEINREYLKIDRVKIFEQLHDMQKHPVMADPIKIAETSGEQVIEVYQGDFHKLYTVLSPG